MDLPDIIILGGSPGAGKSTLMSRLHEYFLYPPKIEFSDIRNIYLDPKWERACPEEESMAFDILLYALKKVLEKDIRPVLLTDFTDERLASLPTALDGYRYRIVTLYAENDKIIKERIIARNSGFKDVDAAAAWNAKIGPRRLLPFEDKIKIDSLSETAVFERCLETLSRPYFSAG